MMPGEPVRADYAHEIELGRHLAISSTELKHSGVYKAVVVNQYGSEERGLELTVYKEEDAGSKDDATSHCVVSSRPIPIPEVGKYVAEHHANSNQAFKDLYKVCVTVNNITVFLLNIISESIKTVIVFLMHKVLS